MTYLLDANVLIALTVEEHEHHERSTTWAAGTVQLAVCPMVEGALVRFLLRLGESAVTAAEVVRGVRSRPLCEFWPDSISYDDVAMGHVQSHRQVTDAYLVSLARANGAVLATLDEGLAAAFPEHTVLLPP